MIGDLFQQYAAKYVGISRGIPLANSNQLWGLLWGVLVFGELHGRSASTYAQVIGGSLLMLLGVGAIAASSASSGEQKRGRKRQSEKAGVTAWMRTTLKRGWKGEQASGEDKPSRTVWDWLLVAVASGVFLVLAWMARVPQISVNWGMVGLLTAASLAIAFRLRRGVVEDYQIPIAEMCAARVDLD